MCTLMPATSMKTDGGGAQRAVNADTGRSGAQLIATNAARDAAITATVAALPEPEEVQVKIDWANDVTEDVTTAQGPGGQNVNKVSSAVQLRFDARRSLSLPHDVSTRLQRIAGRRLTREGVIVIAALRHRSQEQNRKDARERLVEMIREAAKQPVPRRATKPTKASRRRRLDTKARRSKIKRLRGEKPAYD